MAEYKAYLIKYNGNCIGDYSNLEEEIKKCANWWNYMTNTFIVITGETVNALWERLEIYFPKKDNLIIIGVTNHYQGSLPKDAWEWIQENLGSRTIKKEEYSENL